MDFTSKIRALEEFDALVVGPLWKKLKNFKYRLCIAADTLWPIAKKMPAHGLVPILFEGNGAKPDGSVLFNEKSSLESKQIFNEGHKMMEYFLK